MHRLSSKLLVSEVLPALLTSSSSSEDQIVKALTTLATAGVTVPALRESTKDRGIQDSECEHITAKAHAPILCTGMLRILTNTGVTSFSSEAIVRLGREYSKLYKVEATVLADELHRSDRSLRGCQRSAC